MHIGIDASRITVARRTGTERYALDLIRALLAQGAPHTFTLYLRAQPAPGLLSNGDLRVIPFPRLWTHVRLSWELLTTSPRPDVLFVPAHVVPLVHPLPAVVTVHDLGYRYFPEAHPLGQRLYLDWSTRFSARAATHVIADSQATKRDLERFYGLPAEKVTVVYPGRDKSFRRVDPASVRAKYNLPERYLLHVGTLQPRKNIQRLIEATLHVSSRSIPEGRFTPDVLLVLVGRAGWLSEPILAAAQAHPQHVRVLQDVPDDDLPGLYSGAIAFVFPSLYEGFGFPVLEAMACGVPVVCSNTSSLPEVAGDAALQVDPADTPALAAAITRILTEPGLRGSLIAKGLAQIQNFSWEHAARETLAVLEKAGKEGNEGK
jgi:glycosyltransferase involved in cell wall biosynthesis